jgi:DNA-binding FrmR family transcriptional regulator
MTDTQTSFNQIDGHLTRLDGTVADLHESFAEVLAELAALREAYNRLYTHLAHRHLTPPRTVR